MSFERHPILTYLLLPADGLLLWMFLADQLLRKLVDVGDAILVVLKVLLELVELLLEHLNMLEILSELIGGDKRLFVADPEHDLVALARELDESKGLLQLETLFLETTQQEVPQTVKFYKALLFSRFFKRPPLYHYHGTADNMASRSKSPIQK